MYTAYGTTDGLSSWSRSRTVLLHTAPAAAQIEFSVFVADLKLQTRGGLDLHVKLK